MKTTLLFFTYLVCSFNLYSQDIPTYPQILKSFFKKYSIESDQENFLSFAKKKEGWFIQKINRLNNDSVLSENLFWSAKNKRFSNPDSLFELQEYPEDYETEIKSYLTGDGVYMWNDYERCRYHGYIGWEDDMIKDFEDQPKLSDTLLEGLGRAYASASNKYLWYQHGGRQNEKDTMQTMLRPLQMPSSARLEKAIGLLTKSMNSYDRLLKQNPSYTTLVGNVHLKKFNECFHAYMQLILAMQDEKARSFVQKAELAEPYVLQAKNYLNSCDKNAILFSFGDNDTYQLWYVQEKENFRKDVSVINLSLLGLPVYIDMLKKRKMVSFSATPTFYENSGAGASYFKEPKEDDFLAKQLNIKDFLKNIYSRKDTVQYFINNQWQINSTYATKDINLLINTSAFNNISGIKTMADNISIKLSEYMFNSDVIMLDIINDNINKRPIYFTSENTNLFDNHLLQQGIVYRLFPINPATRETFLKKEMSNLEKFADSIYKPVVSFNLNNVKNISPDGNNVFFQLYSKITDYYNDRGEQKKASHWLSKVDKVITEIKVENMPVAYNLSTSLLKMDKEKGKRYLELYGAYYFDKYSSPSAIKGFVSKKDCLDSINALQNYLVEENMGSPLLELFIKKVEAN